MKDKNDKDLALGDKVTLHGTVVALENGLAIETDPVNLPGSEKFVQRVSIHDGSMVEKVEHVEHVEKVEQVEKVTA